MTNSNLETPNRLPSSLRDPAGFLFKHGGGLYRTVNHDYSENFDFLLSSGLYEYLIDKKMLVEHTIEPDGQSLFGFDVYKVLAVKEIPFISYPFEWCFSQLKSAAIFTLELQKIALEHNMTLKDASALNIQYLGSRPIFIDTLSFEKYQADSPWLAYEQFCRHFLAPLALMSCRDDRLSQLLRIYSDGIPLDLASKLVGIRVCSNFSLFCNLTLQTMIMQLFKKKVDTAENAQTKLPTMKLSHFKILLDDLLNLLKQFKTKKRTSVWGNYYQECTYSEESVASKRQIVQDLLNTHHPAVVWDLGANDGTFSRLASEMGIRTMSFDFDHGAVENNYLDAVKRNDSYLLPLIMDLTNPTPSAGWAHTRIRSLQDRGPCDVMLALALIHHLVITNGIPMLDVAKYFASLCRALIIEFVPEDDPQAVQMRKAKPTKNFDLLYNREIFEREFSRYFDLFEPFPIAGSERLIYFAQTI